MYLIEDLKLSDTALEMFIEIIFHSDLCEDRTYLDGKGNFSFRLHSLIS